MQGAKKGAQESPQVPVRVRAELGSTQQAPGNGHCCKGGGQHAPKAQPDQSLPTLCRYETTGATSTGRAIQNLGLSVFPTSGGNKQLDSGVGSLASIIPLLMSLLLGGDSREKGDAKPSCYLDMKGLPTLPMKLVDRIWNLEYVNMEEFLPAPSLWKAWSGHSTSFRQSRVKKLSDESWTS